MHTCAGVIERYWNDPELMTRISSKMSAMDLAPGERKPSKKISTVSFTVVVNNFPQHVHSAPSEAVLPKARHSSEQKKVFVSCASLILSPWCRGA